jgi:lysozyme
MKRTVKGVAMGLALMGILMLSACNRHVMSRAATSTASVPAIPAMPVARSAVAMPGEAPFRVMPARFADAHPVDWPGRTPAAYSVHGIDVSRWQGVIDWPTARAHGVNFAFIKATEGGDHADPAFRRNWDGAAAAGVPRAGYHFYYFCRSAAEQAAWFIANVPREVGALPPVLDLEWNGESVTCPHRPSAATVRAEAATFLNIVSKHYNQQPIVYTTVDFWHDNELWRLQGMQPWLRAVTKHPSEVYPDARSWTFWQYSGTGLIPGIPEKVDLNAFTGSEGDWAVWLAQNRG